MARNRAGEKLFGRLATRRLAGRADSPYKVAMADFTLYLGNKAYSSWSLRGWLACKLAGMPFDEAVHDMAAADWPQWVRGISPSAKVPVLKHGERVIWESIAIAEYLAELFPTAGMWPEDAAARAQARVISAEMHAGFVELRKAMWMNTRRRFTGKGRTPGALADIARIVTLWRSTREGFGAGGPFLFGRRLTVADAMYAPVASRFITWEPELPDDAKAYVAAVWDHPLLQEWRKAADAETWTNPRYETPGD
jgi:glutathione S-transferase